MSGSRLERFDTAVLSALEVMRFVAKHAALPGSPSQAELRSAANVVDDARRAWLSASTDETGPVPAVSADRAAELAPDTRPSVAPTAAQAEAVGVGRVEPANPSALQQAADALRECADRVDGLYGVGCEAVSSTSTDEETDRIIEKANAIIDRAHAAIARIKSEPSAIERRWYSKGYAACQADVVAHYTASPDDMEIDDFVESVDLGGHVGAAARAKEKP